MIYEFLYNSKPADTHIIIITAIFILVYFGFFLYNYCVSRPPKEKYHTSTTYRYDTDLQKDVIISQTVSKNSIDPYNKKFYMRGMTISALFGIIFSIIFAFELYDHVTTPSENTKTTDLYRITKEKDFLTFTAKKSYNHLYQTKTMKITYTNSDEYVIVTDHQTYKIPKKSVKEH